MLLQLMGSESLAIDLTAWLRLRDVLRLHSLGRAVRSSVREAASRHSGNARLYVFGGSGGLEASARSLSSAEFFFLGANEWSAIAPMPTARSDAAAVAIDQRLYVSGGVAHGKAVDSIDCYDIAGASWSALAPMSEQRRSHAAVQVNGQIYVCGGRGFVPMSTAEAYDVAACRWDDLPSMLFERQGHAAAAMGSFVYVCGGFARCSGQTVFDTEWHEEVCSAEVFEPSTNSWKPLPDMSEKRGGHTLVSMEGYLYACGGSHSRQSLVKNSVERFDPLRGSWEQVVPMPVARVCHTAGVIDGCIFICGGRSRMSVSREPCEWESDHVYLFDVELGQWTSTTPLRCSRHSHAAAAVAF